MQEENDGSNSRAEGNYSTRRKSVMPRQLLPSLVVFLALLFGPSFSYCAFLSVLLRLSLNTTCEHLCRMHTQTTTSTNRKLETVMNVKHMTELKTCILQKINLSALDPETVSVISQLFRIASVESATQPDHVCQNTHSYYTCR